MEGTKSEWILWVPGASNHFSCLKILIITGNRRKEIKKDVNENIVKLVNEIIPYMVF